MSSFENSSTESHIIQYAMCYFEKLQLPADKVKKINWLKVVQLFEKI